jgi:dTDP-4-dehydrorhamnose reductase
VPTDILGLNYYVASDRYLDDAIDRYPQNQHHRGRDGWFVDTEAVRSPRGLAGHRAHLEMAWRRYARPIAITEVHLDCTGEEQSRWLMEAWRAAVGANHDGIPVVAVAPWALFGSVDWDSLLTRNTGYYEPGAFDVRGGLVRQRALGRVIADLASRGESDQPAAQGSGWWRRHEHEHLHSDLSNRQEQPLLVVGRGTLARSISAACIQRGIPHLVAGRAEVDIADEGAVRRFLDRCAPWAIVNACGYVRVDDAEREAERCWREKRYRPGGAGCGGGEPGHPIRHLFIGSRVRRNAERTVPRGCARHPLSVYGDSKAAAERVVLDRMASALVIRTAAFFGKEDDSNFVVQALQSVAAARPWRAADDLIITPTYVPDLADAALELLFDGASGVWHLSNGTAVSWYEFARQAARRLGFDVGLIIPSRAAELQLVARRPAFSALGSNRGALMPCLDSALDRLVRDIDRARFLPTCATS